MVRLDTLQESIELALGTTEKENIDQLIRYLDEETDFYTAPASKDNHNAFEGGLAKHSWDVMNLFAMKCDLYKLDHVPIDSQIICGLMHDLCKVNYYQRKEVADSLIDEGKLLPYHIVKTIWVTNDQLPLGHGGKSVMMLMEYIKLTDQEKALIRWHMGSFESGGSHTDYYTMKAWRAACQKWPEVIAIHTADYEAATYFTTKERWVKEVY